VADSYLFFRRCNLKKVIRTICILPRRTSTGNLDVTFKISYIYDFAKTMQAAVIQKHENLNIRNTGQNEEQHRNYKMLKVGGGQAYDLSSV
jgi:hypothetical protein